MAEQLNGDLLKRFYQLQREIFASGRDTDSLLGLLSRASRDIFQGAGFAVLFYDIGNRTARVRFNEGFPPSFLEPFKKKFGDDRAEKRAVLPQIVPGEGGRCEYLLPLGDRTEPFGMLVTRLPEKAQGLDEFRQLSSDAIASVMEMEIVRMQLAELSTLLDVGKAVSSTLDLTELLKKIMAMGTQVMRCETATVYMVDKKTKELYFNIVLGDEAVGDKLREIRLPFGTGLAGWCAKENQPIIVPDASNDPRFFKKADKNSGFITRSMICVPMRLKDEVIGVIQVLNRTGDIPFNDHDVEILEAIANQAVSSLDNARLYENIQRVYLSTVEVLATAIDAKDPYTHGHSRRVTDYSVAIAEEMGLAKTELETVRYAGLLHDVGKIGIKDSIIGKPERLTDEEYGIIKRHPVIGAEILKPVEFLSDKVPGVLHHHEYFDGRGYPNHLKGEDIPFIGRVICVADAFDAMTSDRPYRKGLNVNVAIGELKKFSGKQFDPFCVDAFLKAFERRIYEWFEKAPGSDELVLKPEPAGSIKFPEAPAAVQGEKTKESTQPFPPVHPNEKPVNGTPSSQPFPPIHPDEKPASGTLSTQPFPPIHPEETSKEGKPSSQPFPPIHPNESTPPPEKKG